MCVSGERGALGTHLEATGGASQKAFGSSAVDHQISVTRRKRIHRHVYYSKEIAPVQN